MLDKLVPITSENSIRQVVASIFLLEPIYQPERFEKFREKLSSYQKFEIIKANRFKLDKGLLENNPEGAVELGFRFIRFEDGKLTSILKGENARTPDRERAVYGYYSLKYEGWENFREVFLKDFSALAGEDLPFFGAISLNYLNEFDWKSDLDIPVSEIFASEEYFSSKFLNSQNSSFHLKTEEAKDSFKEIEKLEVVVDKKGRKILINSQLALEYFKPNKVSEYSENGLLKEHFDTIHTQIKSTLREIFSPEIKQKINLV